MEKALYKYKLLQKRDLKLANQDLSERLVDLKRTSGQTDMSLRELQKDFPELRDKLFKAYDDKNNSFVKQVFCERIQDEVLYEIFQTII